MASTIANNQYVIVDRGLVISTFKGSDLPEYNEDMTNVIDVTSLSEKPQINWTYNSSSETFAAPVVAEEPEETIVEETLSPVQLLKEDLRVAVDSIDYMGTVFQSGGFTIPIINSYVSLLAIGVSLPENFFWLDKFNNKVPMTEEQFKTFASLAITNYYTHFANYVDERIAL